MFLFSHSLPHTFLVIVYSCFVHSCFWKFTMKFKCSVIVISGQAHQVHFGISFIITRSLCRVSFSQLFSVFNRHARSYTSFSQFIDFSLRDSIDNYNKDQRLNWLAVSVTYPCVFGTLLLIWSRFFVALLFRLDFRLA